MDKPENVRLALGWRRGKSRIIEAAVEHRLATGGSAVVVYPDHYHVFTPEETKIVQARR